MGAKGLRAGHGQQFGAGRLVRPVTTPSGEVATLTQVGSYDRLGEAHDAIHVWAAANHRSFAGMSWEMYGDWHEDPNRLETTLYLLH